MRLSELSLTDLRALRSTLTDQTIGLDIGAGDKVELHHEVNDEIIIRVNKIWKSYVRENRN